jgi:hypothetical protein
MPDQDPQPALPAPGHTTAGRAPAPPTDALSLEECVRRFGVSVSTLRRRLREGAVAGAYKVPGPKGDEWRIPAGAMLALGYGDRDADDRMEDGPQLKDTAEVQSDLAAILRAVESNATVIEALAEHLASERRQLAAAEEDRGAAVQAREDARVQAARLEAELLAERARREAAEAELERRRRPWWRR